MIDFEDQTDPEADDGCDHDDSPDDDTVYVVMVGDMSTGYRSVGPFGSFGAALAWADNLVGECAWVMPLRAPNTPDATKP